MSIQEIVNILIDGGIEEGEANAETKLLIEHFCNFNAIDLIFGKKLDTKNFELVKEKAQLRVKTRQPIQHIIGWAYFMNDKFKVNPDVLIPRDDTEFVVRKAIEIINSNNLKKALDIGTGTGCIACEIAKLTLAQVIGLDISTEALHVALENATALNLCNKAIFRKSDIFSNVKDDETFDLIISNPPYIPIKQKGNLQTEVHFDPDLALFTSDENGIEFYEKIISQASKFLNPKGYIVFELGINQSQFVKSILEKYGYGEISIEKDLAQIDRVISAKKI